VTVELVHSQPSQDMEQRILRIRHDALILANEMTKAQARSSYLILERARDDLSKVLDRADWKCGGIQSE
jgi:hypothetical protein